MSNNKGKHYIPTKKSSDFLDKFGSTDYFITYYAGANGVGKTALLANMVRNMCYPDDQNKWFNQKLFTDFPYPLKNIRIVSNANTLKETLIPTLKEWLPEGRYTTSKEGKQYEYHWTTDTGWEIFILTYDQPLSTFESANVSIVLFDEPPSEVIFKANVSRLRRGGQIGILATPLEGSEWMYDAIITNTDDTTTYIQAEIEDACIEHGERGYLPHSAIERMVAQYTPDEQQARIFGKFQHLTGLVFKEFKREVHVIEPFPITRKDFVTIHSLDPHPRTADAAVWIATDRQGRMFVVDEVFDNFNTEQLARRLKDKDLEYEVQTRMIDPWALDKDQHSQKSLVDRLSDNGLHGYIARSKKRSEAIRIFHDYFSYTMQNGEMIKPPKLYVFSTCVRFIWEVEHWKYNEFVGKSAERRDPSNKPQDKDDHAIEAGGGILLYNPVFTEPPPKKARQPVVDMDRAGDPY